MKNRLTRILEHCFIEHSHYLFPITEKNQTGATHIFEALHRFFDRWRSSLELSKTQYFQMRNCTSRNENRFSFSHLQRFIAWKVFDTIQISFLPTGHSHEDIDQACSTNSQMLKSNNVFTLPELHEQLQKRYNSHSTVTFMVIVVKILIFLNKANLFSFILLFFFATSIFIFFETQTKFHVVRLNLKPLANWSGLAPTTSHFLVMFPLSQMRQKIK